MNTKQVEFFLGALSPSGFAGYFSELVKDETRNVTLIKGTPGCGKSTLLCRLAEALTERGEQVERIRCAGDPASLDAVLCGAKRFCAVDATAPHVLEPAYPGAFENVLSFYTALDRIRLRGQRAEIVSLFRQYKVLTERAARYITAAGSLLQDTARTAQCFTDIAKVRALAKALSRRYLPEVCGPAEEELRLLSAVTCEGILCLQDTVSALADTIIVLDDPFGYASKVLLASLREEALAKKHTIITCYCSLSPYEKIEHLILPAQRLAFVTSNASHPMAFPGQRNIHCTRFCCKDGLRLRTNRLRFNKNACEELLGQSVSLLKEAKACHDKLEAYYTAAMDFSAAQNALEDLLKECCQS